MIDFEFREEDSNIFGKILRPIADVYFKDNEDSEVIAFMYIDSGADITLIPQKFGEALGFKVEEDKIIEIGGIGNAIIPIILKKANIRIGNAIIDVKVAWALINEVPYLLGRLDIFDKFNIEFTQKDRKILFKNN